MSTLKLQYGSLQTLTCSLHLDNVGATNGLPSNPNAGREATAISNTTDLAVDVLVQLKTKLQSGTIGGDRAIFLFAYGLLNTSSTYPDVCTGTDGYVALNNPSQLVLIGQIFTGASAQIYNSNMFSVATAFGGVLPSKWGIVVVNSSGIALTNSSSDHVLQYQEVAYTSV